jgi:hypothetical protein
MAMWRSGDLAIWRFGDLAIKAAILPAGPLAIVNQKS